MRGTADNGALDALRALVQRLHDDAVARHVSDVVVDIRAVEFMNAACFNVLVWWLGLIEELAADRRYRLRFEASAMITWQRRSLHTLSCFATDLVSVDVR